MNTITLYQFSKRLNVQVEPQEPQSNTLGGTFSDYIGGVLAPNGKIYFAPYYTSQILELNPTTNTPQLIGTAYTENSKWRGGVLAPNGKIYFAPFNASQILELNPTTNTTQLVGSVYTTSSKWWGGVLAPNGKIYFAPYFYSNILELSGVDNPNVIGSDTLIPSNLSDLPTSNYNKYYNKF
jgi:streptogramin lyase